jgi:hypothetical protein
MTKVPRQEYNIMEKAQEEFHPFELTMNGKTKQFDSGYAMWKWANQQSRNKLETKYDEKSGPFLCDFFQKLWEQAQSKKKKKK